MISRSLFLISVLLLVAVADASDKAKKECEEKEKSLALLDLAKDSITKAKELLPDCQEGNETHPNKTACGQKEKAGAFIDVALELIDEAKENYPECGSASSSSVYSSRRILSYSYSHEGEPQRPLLADCLEFRQQGWTDSGVYTIRPRSPASPGNLTLDVYCDMKTDGGGWTVIQRRGDFTPQEDFYRGWNDYKNGFGSITRDFWLGNDNIYVLSNQGENTVRFDLESEDEELAYAYYDDFQIEDEHRKYKIRIGNYSGNAGDAMSYNDGSKFSTKDQQNDINGDIPCIADRSGAMWYKRCGNCNPNGVYMPGQTDLKSVNWYKWKYFYNLANFEIKLRRKSSL